MNVTVYSLPNCVQCDSTKRMFERNGVDFEAVDLSTDSEAMEKIRALGYTAAPVVTVDDIHWSGFRIEKIKTVIAEKDALRVREAV